MSMHKILIPFLLVLMTALTMSCGKGFQVQEDPHAQLAAAMGMPPEELTDSANMDQNQPTTAPMTATTFSELNSKILQPKCTRCHNAQYTAKPNVYFSNYTESTRFVIPGRPLDSGMYKAAKRITGANSVITEAELQYIYDWILDGARNN